MQKSEISQYIQNHKKSVKNDIHVSTESILILSALKGESYKRTLSHFRESETLFRELSSLSLRLYQLYLYKTFKSLKVQPNKSGNEIVAADKRLESTVTAFLGEDYNVYELGNLNEIVKSQLNSHILYLV